MQVLWRYLELHMSKISFPNICVRHYIRVQRIYHRKLVGNETQNGGEFLDWVADPIYEMLPFYFYNNSYLVLRLVWVFGTAKRLRKHMRWRRMGLHVKFSKLKFNLLPPPVSMFATVRRYLSNARFSLPPMYNEPPVWHNWPLDL